MKGQRAHSWLMIANAPVALLAAMMTFYALFGLGAPGFDAIRLLFGASPFLLAAWLAASNHLMPEERSALALLMAATPPVAVTLLLINLPA
jgi:hypothetical protein